MIKFKLVKGKVLEIFSVPTPLKVKQDYFTKYIYKKWKIPEKAVQMGELRLPMNENMCRKIRYGEVYAMCEARILNGVTSVEASCLATLHKKKPSCSALVLETSRSCLIHQEQTFSLISSPRSIHIENITQGVSYMTRGQAGRNIPKGTYIIRNIKRPIRVSCENSNVDIAPLAKAKKITIIKEENNLDEAIETEIDKEVKDLKLFYEILDKKVDQSDKTGKNKLEQIKQDLSGLKLNDLALPDIKFNYNSPIMKIIATITIIVTGTLVIVVIIKCVFWGHNLWKQKNALSH